MRGRLTHRSFTLVGVRAVAVLRQCHTESFITRWARCYQSFDEMPGQILWRGGVRLVPGEIKQLDYDGFGESPLLVKPVASLP